MRMRMRSAVNDSYINALTCPHAPTRASEILIRAIEEWLCPSYMIRLCVSDGTSGRRHILFVIAVYLYSLFVVYLGLKAANKLDRLSKLGETHPRFAR